MSAAARILGLRRQLGRVGGIFLALALALVLDGMSAGLRQDSNTFRCLPGQSIAISANVPMYVDAPDKIMVQSAPQGVGLRVDQVMAGYWMGGRLFAGAVEVGPEAAAGDHPLVLTFPPDENGKVYTLAYTVRIYSSAAAMRAESPYYTERFLGAAPYPAAGLFVGLGLACLGLVFLLSFRLESCLAAEGMAEVYKFRRLPEHLELEFALGGHHGLRPGDKVQILAANLLNVGQATITEVRDNAAVASASPLLGVGPDSFVRLDPSAS